MDAFFNGINWFFNGFSWWVAVVITTFYIVIDWLYAVYVAYVQQKRPIAASNAGSLIYGLNAVGIMTYMECPAYVAFVVLGSWVGTYIAVRREAVKQRMTPGASGVPS